MEDSRELALKETQQGHLPSTQVREVMPEVEEEVHLKDYLDIILRRKWTVIITLLVTFISVAVYTFSTTPIYKATGTIKASPKGLQIGSFEDQSSNMLRSFEYLRTQVELLKSESVLQKVINEQNLTEHPRFNPEPAKEGEGLFSFIPATLAAIKDLIRPSSSSAGENIIPELQAMISYEGILKNLQSSFSVTPKQDTQLIQITCENPDPELAARLVNSMMDQYLTTLMDNKIASFKTANVFLEKRIQESRIKLEKSEQELNAFARKTGILSMDTRLNLIMRQLEELNEALAKSVTKRLQAESLYLQTIKNGGENMPQILDDPLIQSLKTQFSKLQSEYQDLSTVFKPAYPKMVKLKAKMDDVKSEILAEKDRLLLSVRNQYESALENERRLSERAKKQKELAMRLNDRATQYKILKREVDSNKEIYDNLLGKSKEIEASIGADMGNIEIVDNARVPAFPAKPKTRMNLLLGIIIGAIAGLGLAFGFEYMDNTIKNPEEFPRRYQIPILGLIPFKDSAKDDKEIAHTFYSDPRAPLSESIRTAMVSIELSSAGAPPKTILVTSVLPNAGKSTISSNLSLSLLPSSSRTLVIDTDLRKPTLHKIFGDGTNDRGLSNYLTGTAKTQEIVRPTEFDKLYYISSGPIPPNPAELLASKRMRDFIHRASQNFDYIIIDAPPFHGFAEILILSNMVDGVILVSELNQTPREGVKYFKKAVTNVGGRILGVLANKVSKKSGGYGYGGYGYGGYKYHDYSYGREES